MSAPPIGMPVDWRTLPLVAAGRSVIEASAGTGKTWTIAALYLRLLLERGLSPRQIVVTTFTEAAAQELRERLRSKLQWAVLHALSHQTEREPARETEQIAPPADEQWLRQRWQHGAASQADDLTRLRLALAELDMAPVSTLHGLCRRVLADHPFACGAPFVLGDLLASDDLLEEVTGDLWRRLQQGDGSDVLQQLQQQARIELSLGSLGQQLKICLAPDVSVGCITDDAIAQMLPPAWAPRLRAVADSDALFTANCALRKYWRELADLIDDQAALPATRHTDKGLKKAAALTGVSAAGKKHPELLAVAAFSAQVADFIEVLRELPRRRFWHAISAAARQAMQSRMQARHQLSFDELLGKVATALQRESAAGAARPLADALFVAWPVALVDEFQDTDGQQYGILDAIYRDAAAPGTDAGAVRGRLVMIGDPKQAIYRFRGGDIHAYQRATAQADADGRLTLDTNHRSARALVQAFNQFYAVGGETLSADAGGPIRYQPVVASGRCDAAPYTVDGAPCAQPLQIHCLHTCPDAAPERVALALTVCANQIAELLQSGRHRIGEQCVQPSDVAVLLPTARQITELRDLLRERGVPCVTSTRSSVFDTDLARELQIVLYAVVHHDEPGALRAAAATRLWGASFSQLQQWGDDVASWQPVTQAFRNWHEDWHARGIQCVVEALIERMAPRYLRTLGGERALTDLRHLGELLQTQSENLAGTEALLAWFGDARKGDALAAGDAADAAQLRIESDSPRVRLMTLHASKGLEFPLVWLPLMWQHGERTGAALHVLSDPASGQRTVEFCEAAKQRERLDLQDERFRVLYVALTRAIHACHVFALPPERRRDARAQGAATGTARSALDVMLARMTPAPVAAADVDNALSKVTGEATPAIRWIDGWQPLGTRCLTLAVDVPAARHARPLPPLPPGPLAGKHSFTTLTQDSQRGAIDPDASANDEADSEASALAAALAGEVASEMVGEPNAARAGWLGETSGETSAEAALVSAHSQLQALAAVRGTDFGNAVHAIFEHRVVGQPMAEQRALIAHWLNDAGVSRREITQAALIDTLAQRIDGVLDAQLTTSLRLGALPAQHLRAEMAFYFSLDHVAMPALRAACAAHGEPELVPRSTRVLSGLMNGKIDLLFEHDGRFHVLDYKGNYLGEHMADYQGEALRAAMDHSHYRFQALLYTVALDRYLRQRLGSGYQRQRQLGECFYVFIRAAGLAPDAGVWRHRFTDGLLDAVGAVLSGHPRAPEAA